MEIRNYLESTYLKTALQAGISEVANRETALELVREAIECGFKAAVVRPEYVQQAKALVADASSPRARARP